MGQWGWNKSFPTGSSHSTDRYTTWHTFQTKGGRACPSSSSHHQALHLVFSMPYGTSEGDYLARLLKNKYWLCSRTSGVVIEAQVHANARLEERILWVNCFTNIGRLLEQLSHCFMILYPYPPPPPTTHASQAPQMQYTARLLFSVPPKRSPSATKI